VYGGYCEKSKSTIFAYKNYKSLQKLLKEAEEVVQKIKNDIKDLKDEITKYSTEKQKLERKIVKAK
jgi:chromosome segregation ATPase